LENGGPNGLFALLYLGEEKGKKVRLEYREELGEEKGKKVRLEYHEKNTTSNANVTM
jgi:hypothetical protein